MRRRDFFRAGALAGIGCFFAGAAGARTTQDGDRDPASKLERTKGPIAISTWKHGLPANTAACRIMSVSGSALDAAMRGVMITEDDPNISSVGYGGNPNADGVMQLDAAIMDGRNLEAGSVAGLEKIKHPIAVARKVMEQTPHVMLVGDGARRFAVANGFEEEDILSPEAKKRWEDWKKRPRRNRRSSGDHDTIGMVTMDRAGNLAAACTTSGWSFKTPGRVGDSPLIGQGLYCDNKIGGVTATGDGEEVIKVCGSYQVLEFMRQGVEPEEAIRRVLQRILDRDPPRKPSVAFVALRIDGKVGYASMKPGFHAVVSRGRNHEVIEAPSLLKKENK